MASYMIWLITFICALAIAFVLIYDYSEPETDRYDNKSEEIHILNRTIGELTEQNHQYLAKTQELTKEIQELNKKLIEENNNNKKILSLKKSSETRLGNISEHLVPFLDQFPYNPEDCKFLGMPTDYIVFNLDQGEIVFLEIKTGNAQESKKQRTIRDIIKSGKVYYEKMRIGEKSVKLKRETNLEEANGQA